MGGLGHCGGGGGEGGGEGCGDGGMLPTGSTHCMDMRERKRTGGGGGEM